MKVGTYEQSSLVQSINNHSLAILYKNLDIETSLPNTDYQDNTEYLKEFEPLNNDKPTSNLNNHPSQKFNKLTI